MGQLAIFVLKGIMLEEDYEVYQPSAKTEVYYPLLPCSFKKKYTDWLILQSVISAQQSGVMDHIIT